MAELFADGHRWLILQSPHFGPRGWQIVCPKPTKSTLMDPQCSLGNQSSSSCDAQRNRIGTKKYAISIHIHGLGSCVHVRTARVFSGSCAFGFFLFHEFTQPSRFEMRCTWVSTQIPTTLQKE